MTKSTYMEEWLQSPHTDDEPFTFVVNAENSPRTFSDPHIPSTTLVDANSSTIEAISELMEHMLAIHIGE